MFYYVPEDYDELSMPNAFAVPKQLADITLQDIEQVFPLSQYESKVDGADPFIFRFKYKYNGNSVWLDLNNKKVKVPKCDGKIIMKVTRRNPKYTIESADASTFGAASV